MQLSDITTQLTQYAIYGFYMRSDKTDLGKTAAEFGSTLLDNDLSSISNSNQNNK